MLLWQLADKQRGSSAGSILASKVSLLLRLAVGSAGGEAAAVQAATMPPATPPAACVLGGGVSLLLRLVLGSVAVVGGERQSAELLFKTWERWERQQAAVLHPSKVQLPTGCLLFLSSLLAWVLKGSPLRSRRVSQRAAWLHWDGAQLPANFYTAL